MKISTKSAFLSLLIGSLLISTSQASHVVDDSEIITGKIICMKDKLASSNYLSAFSIEDEQKNEYQIFSENPELVNHPKKRGIKVSTNSVIVSDLINHYNVSFLENLHDKEIKFSKDPLNPNQAKLHLTMDKISFGSNVEALSTSSLNHSIQSNEELEDLSVSSLRQDEDLSISSLNSFGGMPDESKNAPRKILNNVIEDYEPSEDLLAAAIYAVGPVPQMIAPPKPKTRIGMAASWIVGDAAIVNIGKTLGYTYNK